MAWANQKHNENLTVQNSKITGKKANNKNYQNEFISLY
jgi:hypothetical protein